MSLLPLAMAVFTVALGSASAAINVNDSVTYTTSPGDALARFSSYTLTPSTELADFDPAGASKLVLTVSSEGSGNPRTLVATYGGVAMTPAVQAVNPNRNAYIFYRDLDTPIAAGDLQLTFSGPMNGVGVTLFALSGTATGAGEFSSATGSSTSLITTSSNSLVVAASAANSTASATVSQAPLTSLFSGFVGSASGASGHQQGGPAGTTVTSTFSVNNGTATASVEFLAETTPTFNLTISPNGANFNFEWDSQTGKVYDLVTSTDLSTPTSSWPAYDDAVTTYEDLPATSPTNTLTGIASDGPRRFFAVIEKDPPVVQVGQIRVFLVGGQSNADGRASVTGLPTGLPASPINLQQPQDDIDFYYKVENQAPALTTLRPGLSETSGFGPAITFGRSTADQLANGTTTRVAIIKYANGGTNLNVDWLGGGDGTTTGDGPEYATFQQTVSGGLSSLASAYPSASIVIEGMIWLQGESDIQYPGGPTAWNNYQTNLTHFITDIRATYGANLPFVVIRLSNGQTALNAEGLSVVRAAQQTVADSDPFARWVDTDGFGMQGDKLHFDAAGQQSIGTASASQMLLLVQ